MGKYNKPINSTAEAIKQIKKHGLACGGGSCHIDNLFKTKVYNNVVNKLFDAGKLQIAPTVGEWLEEGYTIKKDA